MAKNFDEIIKNLEREVAELKAVRRRSSETLGTITKSATVTSTIRGARYKELDGTYTNSATLDKYGVVTVDTGGTAQIASIAISSARGGRTYYTEPRGSQNNDWEFKIGVVKASAADIATLGGDTTRTLDVQINVEITCTSNFTTTTYQEAA